MAKEMFKDGGPLPDYLGPRGFSKRPSMAPAPWEHLQPLKDDSRTEKLLEELTEEVKSLRESIDRNFGRWQKKNGVWRKGV